MNKRKRLYITVREKRELEEGKRELARLNSTIAKGGGMPHRPSDDEDKGKKSPTPPPM